MMLRFALAILLGFAAGYWLRSTEMPAPEVITIAPAQRQADDSLVAERQPDPKPAPPPHQLPGRSVEERRVSATVQPKQPDCDPVHLDLSLVREDEGRRVVVSSPDGVVIDALDMPIQAGLVPPKPRPWAMGASYNPATQRGGLWVERDLARLRIGADLIQDERGQVAAMVRVGWRF